MLHNALPSQAPPHVSQCVVVSVHTAIAPTAVLIGSHLKRLPGMLSCQQVRKGIAACTRPLQEGTASSSTVPQTHEFNSSCHQPLGPASPVKCDCTDTARPGEAATFDCVQIGCLKAVYQVPQFHT
jgi:hypothetical protein